MNEGGGARLFQNWKSDPVVLNHFFEAVVANFKKFEGKKTSLQIYKSHALYKQAVQGDCTGGIPADGVNTKEGKKWKYWDSLRGMSQDMAKRRFITYLAEIEPSLIDVVPCEEPPTGFPKDTDGTPICAKCNTTVGCNRLLYDNKKFNLKEQLFETEEIHKSPELLKEWARHALETQRCIWGLHRPIPAFQAKQFDGWFNRIENKGFVPYDGNKVLALIKDLVYYHHQLAYDMMQNRSEYSAEEYNEQAYKTFRLKDVYAEVTGLDFIFEVSCTFDSETCNLRRKADKGVNHSHEVLIELPTKINHHTYEEAMRLREELLDLGILPSTGVVGSIEKRVEILRAKLAEHNEKMTRIQAARGRLERRPDAHRKEKNLIRNVHDELSFSQCSRACDAGDVPRLMTALRKGGDPNTETNRGITPLICLVLNNGSVEQFEELAKLNANFNFVNRFGATALSIASVLNEVKLLHGCLKNGATASFPDSQRRTALHWCATASNEDGIHVLLSYVAEAKVNVKEYINLPDKAGDTALFTAARLRNGLMCKVLCSLGADPTKRNSSGKSASMVARERGFGEIADWLDKRVGAGLVKVESDYDTYFERTLRYGGMKTKDALQKFVKIYSKQVGLDLNCPWIVNAADCRADLSDRKIVAKTEQSVFINAHYQFITEPSAVYEELQAIVDAIVTQVKGGKCNPNVIAPCGLLSWTPLMCATLIGDLRGFRLLLKEGAHIDQSNMHGTTPLMLASWLGDVSTLLEIISSGANLSKADNHGFTPQAYASLLPPREEVDANIIEVSIKGKDNAVKLFTPSDIFVLIKRFGVADLKDRIEENRLQYARSHDKSALAKMLMTRGLTDTDSKDFDLARELKTLSCRMGQTTSETYIVRKPVTEVVVIEKPIEHRCYLCTLIVPCSHFPTVASFLKKGSTDDKTEGTSESSVVLRKPQSAFQAELSTATKVYAKPAEVVLQELDIGDRRTDRNLTVVNEYRERVHGSRKAVETLRLKDKAEAEEVRLLQRAKVGERFYPSGVVAKPEDGSSDAEAEDAGKLSSTLPLLLPPVTQESTESELSRVSSYSSLATENALPSVPMTTVFSFFSNLQSHSPLKSALRSDGRKKERRNVRFNLDRIVEKQPSQRALVVVKKDSNALALRNALLPIIPTEIATLHPSPLSPKGRSVYMFTTDRINDSRMREGSLLVRSSEEIADTYEAAHASGAGRPSIVLSGWLFVNLKDTELNSLPLKDVLLSTEKWAFILNDTNQAMKGALDPNDLSLHLSLCVSSSAPLLQCMICKVGYVRMKAGATLAGVSEQEIKSFCLPCCLRKSLFEKVKVLTSDDFQASVLAKWPEFGKDTSPTLAAVSLLSIAEVPYSDDISIESSLAGIRIATPKAEVSDKQLSKLSPVSQRSSSPTLSSMYSPVSSYGSPMSLSKVCNNRNSSSPQIKQLGSTLSLGTKHSASSVTSSSPTKRIRAPVLSPELSLVPMLLSKGHFHDAESFLRITHCNMHTQGKYDVLVQTQILSMQAEMYKLMGLWPLALALYLDAADMLASEMGHENEHTRMAVCAVLFCLKLVDRDDIARIYISALSSRLKNDINIRKVEVAEKILTYYRIENKRIMKIDSLGRRILSLRPSNALIRRLYDIDGLGGLYILMSCTDGFPVVCRLSFLAFCSKHYEPRVCHLYEFCQMCLKLRACQNSALQRTLNQQLIARFLSKTLVSKSDISRLFHEYNTESAAIKAVTAFSKAGFMFGYEILVDLLLYALRELLPMFKKYFYSEVEGYLLRVTCFDVEAEAYHLNACVVVEFFKNVMRRKRGVAAKTINPKKTGSA